MPRWIARPRAACTPPAIPTACVRRLPGLALMALALLTASCGKEGLIVPSDGLPGLPSPSQLIVYPDTPTLIETWADLAPPGPGEEDTLMTVEEVYALGPGAVHGLIFDFTPADQFEIFRRETGGFRLIKDFPLRPAKKFLQSHTDVFLFTDPRPRPRPLQDYVARGIVAGGTTPTSPKTNHARIAGRGVAGNLDFTAPTGVFPPRPAPDSLLYMEWAPYPGAAGYWVHVYQLTNQSGDQIIASGIPAPIYVGVTRDHFLCYFPAGVTSYRVGDPLPAGARLVTQRPMINNQLYSVRISAVNADGELIAYTGAGESKQVFRSETTYRVFPLGAAVVNTKPDLPPPTGSEPTRAGPIPTSDPRVWIYPAGTLPSKMR